MNEKLQILKMLENKQITAAEAEKLLKAIDGGGSVSSSSTSTPFAPPPMPSTYENTSYSAPPPPPAPLPKKEYDSYTYASNSGSRPPASSSSGLDDISRKFESFARDMAPKMQKFTEVAAEKISGAAEWVSNQISSDPSGGARAIGGAPPPLQSHRPMSSAKPFAPSGGVIEKNIEVPVETGGYNELSLSGINGDVRIKGYNGDKITARLVYRPKHPTASIEMVKLGGKYFLKYEPDDFHSVTIDAFVPERAFSVIKVDGINVQLDCASLAANNMVFQNANGSTRLNALTANNIVAESSGGAFQVAHISAEIATIENLNGAMDASELDIQKLKLSNYNSPLSIIMSRFNRFTDYTWAVETGNAKLGLNLPTLPDLGYHIKAHAAMSEIRLSLTGLQFLINEPSLVEARSINFDSSAKRVKLAVETSNAPLSIS